MKFANYLFNARKVNNLGDNMQLIAIDQIYERMGIPQKDIVYIDKNELSTYKGEYVILPVTMPLIDYIDGGISARFSDHIVPVFLGLTLVTDTLLPEEVEYYRRFEPIGCRDERTLNTLRRYSIQAYLHGCITATLPKREIEGKSFNKVFIVDIPDDLVQYIPDNIKKDAVWRTHLHDEPIDDPKALMRQYYEDYKSEAKLVITSLLHCSVPCIAAGIPVILAKTDISYRFSWVDKLIKIYSKSEFLNINWNPEPIEYEEHKERVIQTTIERLFNAYKKYQAIYDISWFYEQREKNEYIVDAFQTIKTFIDEKMTDFNATYEYSIWGLTQMSTLTVSYIKQRYQNAKLMHVYDSYRKSVFEGITSESPENIRKYKNDIIFVTTNGAQSAAKELFNDIGKSSESYTILEVIR
ncbi:polysaccharide pyruvyl transferase family protein [Desulfitobacterium sp. Sab5]|uniref:polysaccharide pyruvyl transferase family protein n=1 Tax=Desulfitobacterium nosdiversum TaxID=3375356 RepID=UPI003CE8154F